MVPFLAFINHCALQWKVSMLHVNECVCVCVWIWGGGYSIVAVVLYV